MFENFSKQLKMARAALDMSVSTLAETSKVSTVSIIKCEKGDPTINLSIWKVLQHALESEGIEFLNEGGVNIHSKESQEFFISEKNDKFPLGYRRIWNKSL